MFILVMQFFWKYIDDLMGKGLEVSVILELLFYVSASLIPLALPLAILLSSIMTLGNLAENNELTALKSSGLSLYRILRPLTYVVILIAIGTFYFANYVIPVANLKWHSLIFDIQNTKISTIITPGVYSKSLDGYAIKVDEGNNDQFKGILIHDHTNNTEIKTIRAKEGRIYKSDNGKYIFFELKDGVVMEELAPQSPLFSADGKAHSKHSNHPSRRSSFDQATYKIDLSGFDLKQSEEGLFKDKHEMMNVLQINYVIDSVHQKGTTIQQGFVSNVRASHPYFTAKDFKENTAENEEPLSRDELPSSNTVIFDSLTKDQKINAIIRAQTIVREWNQNIYGQAEFLKGYNRDIDDYLIEFHRKFALTVAIVILFFIGAPLGAIVRKGGFGMPVVIAALLFLVYFVLLTIGENLADAGTVSPFVGMWFSAFILAPIAMILMYFAANDLPIFSVESWLRLIRLKK